MEELYIFSKDDKFITILSEETGLVDTWFKDYQNHIPDEPFAFNVKQNSPLLQHIVEENQIAFYDRDGDLRLVRMKELYEVTTKDSHNIRVKCEPTFLELYDHFIEDKRITNGTAQTALNRALEGSRYVGEVTVDLGLATDNFYWIDGIGAVFKIIGTWGGALKDTITLDDNNEIIERKLWIVQRLGTDNGLIVEPDHNAESISRKSLSYVETALWGQGSSLETDGGGFTRYITFEDVEWKVSNGDPVDKPLGQKWVGDPQALSEHGYLHNGTRKHRYGHFSNQDYDNAEDLLMATWQELQERKLKEIIHEATIYEDDKKVSLGDTVTILDRNYNKPIELQSQITGLEYDPIFDVKEIVIVVGKYIDMNEEPLQKDVDNLKEQIKKRPSAQVTENSYPNRKPSTPINVRAVGSYNDIQLYWDYADEIFIKHYEVYGSQVADFVPDTQHLLWRGQVSAFGHMVNTDESWYYYVRAVNYHGTPSDWSVRVDASTVRIKTDDILFGSVTADLLADNLDLANKLDQGTLDWINNEPLYQIEEMNNRLLGKIDNKLEIIDYQNAMIDVNEDLNRINLSVVNVQGEVDDAVAQITAIDASVGNLTFSVSEVRTDLDGLEVSERNYVLGTGTPAIKDRFRSMSNESDEFYFFNVDGARGRNLKLSFDIEVKDIVKSADNASARLQFYLTTDSGNSYPTYYTISLHDYSEHVEVEVLIPSDAISLSFRARFDHIRSGIIKFSNVIAVKGDKYAIGWQPAPEDMADKAQLISYINLSSEDITINSNRINLQGDVYMVDGRTVIGDAVVGTAAIANLAVEKFHLNNGIIDDVHINNMSGEKIIAKTVTVDQLNVTELAGISAELGTVRSGRLLSNNSNMDLNLNTGTLKMSNANFTLGGGASINFEDAGNTLTYRKFDSSDGFSRSSGVGVGDRIGGRYPFAYLGTTGASNLDSLSPYFSGFIANSTAATGTDGAANSVTGFRFQMRSEAIGWQKGITFDFNGSRPSISTINPSEYAYDIGTFGILYGRQAFGITNYSNQQSGWLLETNYSGGSDITLRGQYGSDFNYQIGGNSSSNAIRNIYLRNNPIVVSDRRAKEDINFNELGLDFINSIKTREFRLKQKPSETRVNNLQFGFIAQELVESLEAHGTIVEDYSIIGMGEDGLYNLKETQLIAPTIKAVQDLDLKYTAVTNDITHEVEWLKTENELLRNRIRILEEKVA